jgi:DNA-binding transcriptional LysR family regulator
MDLIHCMRTFIRVAELGNFTAAAHALGTNTSYTSRAVSDLEAHLQTRLMNRTTRKISLTEAGERFLARCRHIVEDVEKAESEAKNTSLVPSGKLRIRSMGGIGTRYLIPLIAKYMEWYPLVEVDLSLQQRMPDMLEEGLDVCILLASALKESNYVSRCIGSLYSVMCASPSYITRHGYPQTLADLNRHRCLNLAPPASEPENWIFEGPNGKEVYFANKGRFSVNLPDALAEAITCGMGIGALPASTFAREREAGRLVRVLPDHRLNLRNIYAVYPSRKYLDAKVRAWIDFVSESLPPLLEKDMQVLAQREWLTLASLDDSDPRSIEDRYSGYQFVEKM